MNEEKKFPEGHFVGMWIGIGIAMFTGVGVSLSVATDNMGFLGIGPAIGVAFGAAIGSSIEKKKKAEGLIRALTADEKRTRKILVAIGLFIAILGPALTLFLILK